MAARKPGPTGSGNGLAGLSPAFVAELRTCRSVDEMRDFLSRKGVWLNRNAAEGVFRSLSHQSLDDDELGDVRGGTGSDPRARGADPFRDPLQFLANQLRKANS